MEILKNLANNIKENFEQSYKVLFYKISNTHEKEKIYRLLSSNPNIRIYDELQSQLSELIKLQNPSTKFSQSELESAVTNYLGECPADEYGVWVYYPWSDRLVHLLNENEFILLRTSRNTYKITPEERDILAQKIVGVIGLSVGQSVSLALTMERSFGELRIADFDTLEMTNLNRIRTGVHNLGVRKTVATAREIAEIDPFLKVTCFHEGITEQNMDQFFLEGGKLDALIEECDSLDIKIKSRIQARKLGIPVIMDTSDRGMLDIERFDLEPDRSLFHGLIDHLDFENSSNQFSADRIELIYAILDKNNLSDRLKLSIDEIGKSIKTWPQLASSVIAGGANAADAYRRIMLKMPLKSGRYYLELE